MLCVLSCAVKAYFYSAWLSNPFLYLYWQSVSVFQIAIFPTAASWLICSGHIVHPDKDSALPATRQKIHLSWPYRKPAYLPVLQLIHPEYRVYINSLCLPIVETNSQDIVIFRKNSCGSSRSNLPAFVISAALSWSALQPRITIFQLAVSSSSWIVFQHFGRPERNIHFRRFILKRSNNLTITTECPLWGLWCLSTYFTL